VKCPEPEASSQQFRSRYSRRGKRVFRVDPEIANRVLDFAMTEKNLDGTKVAGRPVDDRCLRPAK